MKLVHFGILSVDKSESVESFQVFVLHVGMDNVRSKVLKQVGS